MKSSPAHTIDGEYIREWLVLGPLFPDDLDRDFLTDAGGEGNIQPCEGASLTTPVDEIHTWKLYESGSDFISLQDAMKQLLFSVDLKFQSELDDSRQPSTELRQAFEKGGISLSQNAIITMGSRGGDRWAIVSNFSL